MAGQECLVLSLGQATALRAPYCEASVGFRLKEDIVPCFMAFHHLGEDKKGL